jgi:Zn-dependent alcohol dehydrogenase
MSTDQQQFIPQLIDLHRRGKFPVDRISKVYPVAEFKRAVSDMHAGIVRKPFECLLRTFTNRLQVIKPIIEF